MIVDDNIFNLFVIQETLREQYGLACDKANNGLEAVQALENRK